MLNKSPVYDNILNITETFREKKLMLKSFYVADLLLCNKSRLPLVWFALSIGKSTFGIFDAFTDEAGRKAHLAGKVAEALFAQAPELFSQPPVVESVEILAAK